MHKPQIKIYVTAKCNLSCSFCSAKDNMQLSDVLINNKLDLLFKEIDARDELPEITYAGGEPLSKFKDLTTLHNGLKERYPNIKTLLLTNGLLLKKSMRPVLETMDVIKVSIDGYENSERPLTNFYDKNPTALLEMKYYKQLEVWSVVTQKQLSNMRWFEDIAKMHEAIYHYNPRSFSMLFDRYSKDLKTFELLNFSYGYYQISENLKKLAIPENGGFKEFTVTSLFDAFCNKCDTIKELLPNNTLEVSDVMEPTGMKGCTPMIHAIGKEQYQFLKFMTGAFDV